MNGGALLKRGSQRTMQAIFQIENSVVFDDMGEKIAKIGGIFGEQTIQGQFPFGGGELVETDGTGWDFGPFTKLQAMIGIGPALAYCFENQCSSFGGLCSRQGPSIALPLILAAFTPSRCSQALLPMSSAAKFGLGYRVNAIRNTLSRRNSRARLRGQPLHYPGLVHKTKAQTVVQTV